MDDVKFMADLPNTIRCISPSNPVCSVQPVVFLKNPRSVNPLKDCSNIAANTLASNIDILAILGLLPTNIVTVFAQVWLILAIASRIYVLVVASKQPATTSKLNLVGQLGNYGSVRLALARRLASLASRYSPQFADTSGLSVWACAFGWQNRLR